MNGNPIQYFDGKMYHSLQADYVAAGDGTIMYYIQPPSTYDQSAFNSRSATTTSSVIPVTSGGTTSSRE